MASAAGEFDVLLGVWRQRIARRRLVVVARRAALCGLVLAAVLALLGTAGVLPWALVAALPVALVAVLVVTEARHGPTRQEAARLLDHDLGLSARVGTALELERAGHGEPSPLGDRVRQEATLRLSAVGARVATRPAGREWAGLLAATVALGLVLLVPGGPANPSTGGGAGATGGGAGATATTATPAVSAPADTANGDVVATTTARVTTAPAPTTPTVLTPAARRPAAPIPPALGAQPGTASPGASSDATTAGLRGGRIQPPNGSGVVQPASTDNPAATAGADRGVTPVRQPPGTGRTGSAAAGTGHRGAVGEGAAPLPGAPSDRRTGTQAGAGTPGRPKAGAKQTSQEGQPIPGAKNSAGQPTAGQRGKSSGSGSRGAPGAGGQAGASRGRTDPGDQAAQRLRAPGALPLATGFRAGPAPSAGKPGRGSGEGDGRGRGEAERGTGTASGVVAGATVGFAFPELRTAAGARQTLLLNYFGAAP